MLAVPTKSLPRSWNVPTNYMSIGSPGAHLPHSPSEHPDVFSAFMNLKTTVLYGLCFAGSAAGFSAYYPSLALGTLIVLYFLFLIRIKYFKDNPVIYFMFLFMLLIITINTLSRSGWGAEYALAQPRYKFIAVSLLILTYLSLCEIMRRKKAEKYVAFVGLLVASGFFFISSCFYTLKLIEYSETLRRGLLMWYVNRSGLFYPHPVRAEAILNKASNVVDNAYRSFDFPPISDSKGKMFYFSFESPRSKLGDAITIWASKLNKYDKGTLYINRRKLEGDLRFKIYCYYGSAKLSYSGFGVLIKKNLLQPGRYQIGVYVENYENRAIRFIQKYIEIKS